MKIYHMLPRTRRNYPCYGTESEKITFVNSNKAGYSLVANLDITSGELDSAYRATQNGFFEGFNSWVEMANHYNQKTYTDTKTRSTMTGDIIQKNGIDYIVDNCGFLKVTRGATYE